MDMADSDAVNAIRAMDGFDIAGRQIFVAESDPNARPRPVSREGDQQSGF